MDRSIRRIGTSVMALSFMLSGHVLAQPTEFGRLSLNVNIEVAKTPNLIRASGFLADGQWEEAVETFRSVAENEGTSLFKLSSDEDTNWKGFVRYVPLREVCQMQLAETHRSAPAALAAYRSRVDSLAGHWFQQGVEQRDESLLQRIIDQLFVSSYGDDALDQLGQFALERGEYSRARFCWERMSPLLRTPAGVRLELGRNSGLPLWLAFDGADFQRRWNELEPHFRQPETPRSWLAYPDTDVDIAQVLARLVLVSILEGSHQRAHLELNILRRLFPDVEGRIAGRTGKLDELLEAFFDQQPAQLVTGMSNWPTFAGSVTRTRTAVPNGDIAAVPIWEVKLSPPSAELEMIGFGRARIGEAVEGPLSFHPLVVDQFVLWNDAQQIRAHRLHDEADIWGSLDASEGAQIYPAKSSDEENESRTSDFPDMVRRLRKHIGLPRFTMTAHGQKLYARMGDSVTGSRDDAVQREKQQRSFLIGLDLSRQGKTMPGFPIRPDGLRWEFEGSPVTDGARLYVAMRHSSATGTLPELHVACYDLPTVPSQVVRPAWRTKICSAETPAGGAWDEYTHNLLSLHEGTIYCNTNMGAVAAISSDDGQIKWLVEYPRMPLRPTHPDRNDWHYFRDLNPCVCYQGAIFVAPSDCDRVFAVDAMTGSLLWTIALVDAVHLLGVGADHLIVSGLRLYWIDIHSGRLAGEAPGPVGKLADGFARPETVGYGRGILADDLIYWPTRQDILVYQQKLVKVRGRDGGVKTSPKLARAIPLSRPDAKTGGGNVVIADGILLIAAAHKLYALGERSGPANTQQYPADANNLRN